MPKLRLLIADDEPLARERMRSLLALDPMHEIVTECASGPEAVEAILRETPDVALLDIQMPGCDGLEVLARLPDAARARLAVIFVTAHDRFAVHAFDARAVDYLLKPFARDRLQLALQRAGEFLRSRDADQLSGRLSALMERTLGAAPRESDRLAVKADGRIIFVRPVEIVWVEAANNYSILHLEQGRRLMVRESMTALEDRLGASGFARINRSAMVRVETVKELQPKGYGDYDVVLHNGRRLPLSRSLRGQWDKFVPGGI